MLSQVEVYVNLFKQVCENELKIVNLLESIKAELPTTTNNNQNNKELKELIENIKKYLEEITKLIPPVISDHNMITANFNKIDEIKKILDDGIKCDRICLARVINHLTQTEQKNNNFLEELKKRTSIIDDVSNWAKEKYKIVLGMLGIFSFVIFLLFYFTPLGYRVSKSIQYFIMGSIPIAANEEDAKEIKKNKKNNSNEDDHDKDDSDKDDSDR